MLAVRTGWSRAELLALPAEERAFYAETLIDLSKAKPTNE